MSMDIVASIPAELSVYYDYCIGSLKVLHVELSIGHKYIVRNASSAVKLEAMVKEQALQMGEKRLLSPDTDYSAQSYTQDVELPSSCTLKHLEKEIPFVSVFMRGYAPHISFVDYK